jgi:hypothetical protein
MQQRRTSMPTSFSEKNQLDRAYIITGPTSGYGLATAQEVAKHGTVVLVGRDRGKLRALNTRGTILFWDIWLRRRLKSRHGIRAISLASTTGRRQTDCFQIRQQYLLGSPASLTFSRKLHLYSKHGPVKRGVQDPVAGLSRATLP